MTEVPLSKALNPNCSPGAGAMAAHCSRCVFTTHCCVCAHGWLKCRGPISSMGHHTWQYITLLLFIIIIWMSSIAGLKKNTIHTSCNPPLPHTCTADKRRWRVPGLQKEQKKESTRPRRCVTSLPKILCWPAGPHLHTDLQQITGAVRSPLMLQMIHHHPRPKETQNYWNYDYRPVALTSVAMKSFERLVLAYLKASTGPLLDPLQFAYRANRSVDDAVNMGLHFILQHLDRPGTFL